MTLYGVPCTQETVSALCGISREEDLEILLEKFGCNLPEEQGRIVWATKNQDVYGRAEYTEHLQPFP